MSEMMEGFVRALEKAGSTVLRRGEKAVAQCPAHDDGNPSLSFRMGDTGLIFNCHARCESGKILEALGLTWPQVFNNGGKGGGSLGEDLWMPCRKKGCKGYKAAEYEYIDEEGTLLYVVAKCSRKNKDCPQPFAQWVPDASKEHGKAWGLPDTVRRVLYNLRNVIKAAEAGCRIYLMEGEKDSDRMDIDFPDEVSTSAVSGAGKGKWRKEYAKYFKGASEVVVVADCDVPGLEWAQEVFEDLSTIVKKVKVVCSPLMNDGADFSDHRDHGLGLDDFEVVPFEPITKRPPMVIKIEKIDMEKEIVFAGYSQESLEKYLVGSMLRYGHGYSIAPIDIVTNPKFKGVIQAIARLAKRERTISPDVVAGEIESVSKADYDKILDQLLEMEKSSFSEPEKARIAARILRERTIRTHLVRWLNAAGRKAQKETVDLDELFQEMRRGLERHVHEYAELDAMAEPVGDAFCGDVLEEVSQEEEMVMEEVEMGEEKPVVKVVEKAKPKVSAKPGRRAAVVIPMNRAAGH